MRRAALVLVLALVVAADAGARSSDTQGRRPVRIDSVLAKTGLRTVRVNLVRGVCATDFRLATLRQTRTSVRMAFDEQPESSHTPCPALARFECYAVVLRRPLGTRRIVDMTTGRAVPRSPERGLPFSSCPRIALPA